MVLWKKLWYYGKKTYGTIVNYSSYIYFPYNDVILLVVLLLDLLLIYYGKNYVSMEKNRVL